MCRPHKASGTYLGLWTMIVLHRAYHGVRIFLRFCSYACDCALCVCSWRMNSMILQLLPCKSTWFMKTSIPIHSEMSPCGLKEVTPPFSRDSFGVLWRFVRKLQECQVHDKRLKWTVTWYLDPRNKRSPGTNISDLKWREIFVPPLKGTFRHFADLAKSCCSVNSANEQQDTRV